MSDAPAKKGRGRPPKAKVEAVVEKPSPKKAEKIVKEPVAKEIVKEAPAKEENGAKKGRGRPPKGAAAPKKSPPKRAAPAGSGKGRGRPPKAAKKQESADESADADSD